MRKYGVSSASDKKWAKEFLESYKKTPEYAAEQEKFKKEFEDYVLYGKEPYFLDKTVIDDLINYKPKE